MDVAAAHAAELREAIEEWVPEGYRDDDGVWWDGPIQAKALAVLDALVARVADLERERDEIAGTLGRKAIRLAEVAQERDAAVRVGDNLRDALRAMRDDAEVIAAVPIFGQVSIGWIVGRLDAALAAAVTAEPPGGTE